MNSLLACFQCTKQIFKSINHIDGFLMSFFAPPNLRLSSHEKFKLISTSNAPFLLVINSTFSVLICAITKSLSLTMFKHIGFQSIMRQSFVYIHYNQSDEERGWEGEGKEKALRDLP